jgi:hypothetical protein
MDVVQGLPGVQPLLLEAATDVEDLTGEVISDRIFVPRLLFLGCEFGCGFLLHG